MKKSGIKMGTKVAPVLAKLIMRYLKLTIYQASL